MTDREQIEILEGKIAFLMALTKVQGQRLERLENVPPTEEPPPLAKQTPLKGNGDGDA